MSDKDDRAERLAALLRDNLKRRKEQARAAKRDADQGTTPGSGGSGAA